MSDTPSLPGTVPEAPLAEGGDRILEVKIPLYAPGQERRRGRRRALAAAEMARTPAEVQQSAARDGRTSQSSLLVMPRIRAGAMEPLLALLVEIADPPRGEDRELGPIIPFLKLRTVHFARILIHYPSPSKEAPIPRYEGKPQVKESPIPAKLLFSTDFDGSLKAHVDELLTVAGPGLDRVFGFCEGWPGHTHRARAHAFFRKHRVKSNTFYTGTMRRSVDQIRREAELRDRVSTFLDDEAGKPGFPTDPVAVRERIVEFVRSQKVLSWVWQKQEPGPFPTPVAHLVLKAVAAVVALLAVAVFVASRFAGWPAALVGLAVVLVALGVVGYAAWRYLCRLAATDPVIVSGDVKKHTGELAKTEDRIVQNEMSSVIYIKEPLWFRGAVLRAVLAFINFAAKYQDNQGALAGIPSIHFARWVIVDGGRRLVFFSNFDGSWESYLGDFVDKAHNGLTAVWSNCVGFPRTKGLLQEGATNEQQFKAYSRASQIPTQVWYSAYRWLSVSNINNNSKIRLGLYGTMTRAEAAAWLRRFADGAEHEAEPKDGPPKPVPSAAIEVGDLQGLVARSYKPLDYAVYIPVTFDPVTAAGARAWVGGLATRVTPASIGSTEVGAKALNVAFTAAGLEVLGLDEGTMNTFAREFTEGMYAEHRQRVLGDPDPAKAPENWRWGGPEDGLHAVLFLYAATADVLKGLVDDERAHAAAAGVTLRTPLDSITLPGGKEQFGFHDGIGQPRIDGMRPDGGAPTSEPKVPAGEVVLGYANAYGKLPATPSVPDTKAARALGLPEAPPDPFDTSQPLRLDLGKNGTYVVFRQLEQDVKAFWAFVDEQTRAGGAPAAEARKKLAAKMVGRWPNGAPLASEPDREPPRFNPATANDFTYADDLEGNRCPLGAHVRRSNPREGMAPTKAKSLLVADRHRLLRRGRAYGQPLDWSFDPAKILASDVPGERGLHFITFNTDIARQFEFVQNTWVNSMKFDGLYADADPLVAPHADPHSSATRPEEVTDFTVMQCPVRHRVRGIPRFVNMRGGAYLFMPGLKALRYLSDPR
ncbi:MAG: Dyp-type peroxidase [Longimicrobiaceae bacterium]